MTPYGKTVVAVMNASRQGVSNSNSEVGFNGDFTGKRFQALDDAFASFSQRPSIAPKVHVFSLLKSIPNVPGPPPANRREATRLRIR
jgi:hypothetical protein